MPGVSSSCSGAPDSASRDTAVVTPPFLPAGTDAGWFSQVTERIRTDRRSFVERDGTFRASAGRIHADLGLDGLHARRGQYELTLRLSSWGREGFEQSAERVEPLWGACATGGEGPRVMADGTCVRRVELPRLGLTEFWQPIPGGLEQGWEVEERLPGDELLVFHLEVDQPIWWAVDSDGLGASGVGSLGDGWRYGGLAAWDAHGEPVTAWMAATELGLTLRVDDQGAVYPVTIDPTLTESAKLTASDGSYSDYFAWSVSGAGDVDGDGYDDVIVGANGDNDNGSGSGSAYVYRGSSSGVDPSAETKLTASDGADRDEFGYSVSGAGDVDGDGYDDVIVGALYDDDNGTNSGSAYVYGGSSAGVDPSSETKLIAWDGAYGDWFGNSVSGAGDVDGDGYDDVIVGAPYDDDSGSRSGSAYVYRGSSSGVDPSAETKLTATDGATYHGFGFSVSGAGDVDGDGYDDVIVGALYDDDNGTNSGSAYVYGGSSAGVDPSSETKLIAWDGAYGDWFGNSVSGAGDVDGDGYDDVIVGAYGDDDNGPNFGSAVVFEGECALSTWYADTDGDGYGDASSSTDACTAPTGYVTDATDCDDTDNTVYPTATETTGDGVDSDCDGSGGPDDDDDGDGLTWTEEQLLGTSDDDPDSDDDGLLDGAEIKAGTDPLDDDTDDDGLLDGEDDDPLTPAEAGGNGNEGDDPRGCGCASSTPSPVGGLAGLLVFGLALVRRRSSREV